MELNCNTETIIQQGTISQLLVSPWDRDAWNSDVTQKQFLNKEQSVSYLLELGTEMRETEM